MGYIMDNSSTADKLAFSKLGVKWSTFDKLALEIVGISVDIQKSDLLSTITPSTAAKAEFNESWKQ